MQEHDSPLRGELRHSISKEARPAEQQQGKIEIAFISDSILDRTKAGPLPEHVNLWQKAFSNYCCLLGLSAVSAHEQTLAAGLDIHGNIKF